jgi:hypothetical protein
MFDSQKHIAYAIRMRIKLLNNNSRVRLGSILTILTLIIASGADAPFVFATTYLSKSSVILTNMNSGGASSLIVEFTTSSSNTGTNGSLVFTGWTGSGGTGTVATSITPSQNYNGTSCTSITGATSYLPGSPTAAGTAGTGTITVTDATALTASHSYCYVLPSAITANPTSTGQGTVALTAGSDAATNVEFDIISNDQVTVNASVPPSFTLALNANSDNLGALSTGSITGTTGVTATVNTNAKNGWYLLGSDANTGLTSTSQSYTIASKTPGSNASLSAGTEGYLTGLPAGGITQGTGSGTTSATAAYASSGSGNGSGLNTVPAELASSTGTANGAIVTVKEYAAISGNTPAATDYTDTITLVGAGSF